MNSSEIDTYTSSNTQSSEPSGTMAVILTSANTSGINIHSTYTNSDVKLYMNDMLLITIVTATACITALCICFVCGMIDHSCREHVQEDIKAINGIYDPDNANNENCQIEIPKVNSNSNHNQVDMDGVELVLEREEKDNENKAEKQMKVQQQNKIQKQ